MTNIFHKIKLATLGIWLGASTALGADIFVETDPMPFLADGSDQTLAIRPATAPVVFWMARFHMELPEAMVDLEKENAGKGFSHTIKPSLGLAMDYNFHKDLAGSYLGLGGFYIQNEIEKDEVVREFDVAYYFARYGYRWFPFQNSFYFNFWISAGPQEVVKGDSTINGEDYYVAPIRILGGPHFGIKF